MFFKYFASKSQLPGFYIVGIFVENGLKPKSHKHCELLVWSLKHYTIKNSKETSKRIHFLDYLKHDWKCWIFRFYKFMRQLTLLHRLKIYSEGNFRAWFDTNSLSNTKKRQTTFKLQKVNPRNGQR